MAEMIAGALILFVGQISGFSLAVAIANSRRLED